MNLAVVECFKGELSIFMPRSLLMKYIPWYDKEKIKRHDV